MIFIKYEKNAIDVLGREIPVLVSPNYFLSSRTFYCGINGDNLTCVFSDGLRHIFVNSEKRLVIIGLVCGFVALAAIMGYASMGYVRHMNIFWPEEIRQTLEFREVNGQTIVVGTVGNAGVNPDLIMRTGDFTYILTVKNNGTMSHQLYVEGIEKSTRLLEPGQSDKITLNSRYEASYNYYDISNGKHLLGTITAKYVVPLDKIEAK